MLSPVEVSLFPSCDDALAWSPDGELAIAAGEYVQVLTPHHAARLREESVPPSKAGGWHITRFRANLFTHDEWPCLYPQNREDFSVAAELSLSTVIGLAWSPSGLGKYRRSVLTVLTSNLLLSFYEPLGSKRQWTRVGIVNQVLRSQLPPPAELEGLNLRKCNIRSFQWCSPLRIPVGTADSTPILAPEYRWGTQLLTVANDANEVMLLCVRRSPLGQMFSKPYNINVLTLHSLDAVESYTLACTGSLLKSALQSKSRILAVSCGPWLASPVTRHGVVHAATAVVAAIHGTQLRMMKTSVTLGRSGQKEEDSPRQEVLAELTDHPITSSRHRWTAHQFTSSLQWIQTGQSAIITLVAGINAGFLTMYIPRSVYGGNEHETAQVEIHEERLYEPTTSESTGDQEIHLEPISATTTSFDQKNHTWSLHMGTLGGLALAARLREPDNNYAVQPPQWGKVVEEFRERFDLDRDLGGSTVARIWGLASYRGVTAVLFTRHPGDMVVYRMAADDSAMIVFSSEGTGEEGDMQSLFTPRTAHETTRPGADHRRPLLHFVLDAGANGDDGNSHSQKLVYAAACCTITDEQCESLRSQARRCLERLSTVTGADLSEEIAQCAVQSPTINAKTADQLSGPGGYLFERCEVCDAGIAWFSAREAQCANGHLFVRCGLTFLAIQEPGISKFCSWCAIEYLDEEAVALLRADDLGPLHRRVFEIFDTCLYCGGKFQASA